MAQSELSRIESNADFHCVTSWSYEGVRWGGVRLNEFFEYHIAAEKSFDVESAGVILHAQDGYVTSMFFKDALDDSVLIADEMDGQALTIEHGAPLRFVAPRHYGYKNLKHLVKIDFRTDLQPIKRGIRAFLDHPRARVAEEERSRWIPGWLLRHVYRPLISGTVKEFREALEIYENSRARYR